jgi:hypothetical protein
VPWAGTASKGSLFDRAGAPQDPAVAEPDEPASEALSDALSLGRFTFEFLGGAEFSQDRNEFSEVNLYLKFCGDTGWRRESEHAPACGDFADVHTLIDLSLASIPTEQEEPGSGEFVTSKKAVTFAFGVESRAIKLNPVDEHSLFLGPLARGGFQTLTEPAEANEDVDSVNSFWGVGLRMGDYADLAQFNPPLQRYVEVYYGGYEAFGAQRWTFDALLRTDAASGFFVGAKAIVGPGQDDVRVFAGFALNLGALSTAVDSFGQVFD